MATYEELQRMPMSDLRAEFRSGRYIGHTAAMGAGLLQANLAILPEADAIDFFRFCQRNPKPCPLVGVSDTGDPLMRTLGDIDIRTDVPSYNVYRDGELTEQVPDLKDLWRDDLVAFALGCSFTFERALAEAGLPLRHVEQNKIVSMYKTSIPLVPAGKFGGGTVCSMRPFSPENAERAARISRQFPQAHGAPLHIGDPAKIGVSDIDKPDWGDVTEFRSNEIPVFWACGVTPQNALLRARPTLCITHTPGSMLITDVPEDAEVTVLAPAA
ncbi:MAG: putative hydro-lyase [Alphaproteobacteria bacterium]